MKNLGLETVPKEVRKPLEQLVLALTAVKPEAPVPASLDRDAIVKEVTRQVLARMKPARRVHREHRSWTVEQKKAILAEAAMAKQRKWGGVGRVCRKYKISTAHLTIWKHQLQTAAE